jgi:long-subunit acyl-CoA synthetase (AMP-forming)
VAILSENNVDGAITDIACLTHGILVTPLNVHSDAELLAWIFERLDINIVVTDTDERQQRVAEVCAKTGRRLLVYRTGSRTTATAIRGLGATQLRRACAEVDLGAVEALFAQRHIDLFAPATVMFTSGSTGNSKGLVFNHYMLVAKRFARAAALPSVGDSEVLLCYLPLFHTFGRYFEMLGTIFWGGTYVFAGNPSAEALIAELGRVRPTGLISVPVRWTQIRDACFEAMEGAPAAAEESLVREVVGDRLRWGISAAGYLDPKVFRFFHRHGVDLCSGFGMTEATGGITMTPPGEYVDGTVGVPLPGMKVRLGDQGELQIAGVYVARYLDDPAPPGSLPPLDPDADEWIATGDIFRQHSDGYLEIVDRIKDIYKNSRGQTIAPQRVEQKFTSVPGIRRVFLAGDHRDHNVLLVVPDRDDALLVTQSDEEVHDYFGQIVASVNAGLAPYERVVNFEVIDRDFSVEMDELTSKGSFRRRTIEENFAPAIEKLYRSNHVEFGLGSLRVRIPRWFYRDLGILEDDIVARGDGVVNRRSGIELHLGRGADGAIRIGDLEYRLETDVVDLGVFAKHPRLWIGNPSLVAFSPCKEGWDLPLRNISEQVRLPRRPPQIKGTASEEQPRIGDERLRDVHLLSVDALFGQTQEARAALERLGQELAGSDSRTGSVIRRRMEALAFRPEEEIRALAYRILLLDVPLIDYDTVFPAFLESGLTFLDEENIAYIARARRGERRLQAWRQRLYSYRTQLEWPGPPVRRRQFRRVFRLLDDFARNHRDDFAAVQAEFACWALFRQDPVLSRAAHAHFDSLMKWYGEMLARTLPASREVRTEGKVVFEFGISAAERSHLESVLFDRTFLLHSIMHAFNEDGFDWSRVPPEGVWVSAMLSHQQLRLYRLGINLVDGRHFDLLLVAGDFLRKREVKDTILWLTALSGHVLGTPTLPRFGAWRADLGAVTVAYVSDLTAWERIRELSGQHDVRDPISTRVAWRKLYVRAMATFFRAWEQSGYRIVPGAMTPTNVALPDADFHEGTAILSIAGWRPYEEPLSLVHPLVRSFYRLTEAHYPRSREILQLDWIFDACLEALGDAKGREFLETLAASLAERVGGNASLLRAVNEYRARLSRQPHIPLPVLCAIDRYREWERMNPAASPEAREEAVVQMIHLYRMDRFEEAFRYHVYEKTYFARSGEAVAEAFRRLIERRLKEGAELAGHLEELSHLQGLLTDPVDRAVFSRMVFPQAARTQKLELLALGGTDAARVIVRSEILDDAGSRYIVREPISAVEIGLLYRLILDTDYPMHIAELDHQLVITDSLERVVGGLCYRRQEGESVYVDGIVIANALMNQGLGGRLLEDFCVRMAAQGARLVKTNFFLRGLFSKHGFQVNQRWGGLIRFLGEEPPPS